jgi:hypothetical protein
VSPELTLAPLGNCFSVCVMKLANGSSVFALAFGPRDTNVSVPTADLTASGCTPSSAAIVPTFQCSA